MTIADPLIRGAGAVMVVASSLLAPTVAAAQAVVVEGRVIEAGGTGIEGAIVELEGQRPTITNGEGGFRFEKVQPGRRWVRVRAFGYVSLDGTVLVGRDTTVTLTLELAPFQLDSLVVAAHGVEVNGQVWDTLRGFPLADADVMTSQGQVTASNGRGRFKVDAWENVPIRILVRAFGYLPVDTLVVPSGDERIRFELEDDSVVDRMIGVEVRRLEDRAHPQISALMGSMNRDDLLRWSGTTLMELLRTKFPIHGRRVRCVIFDEDYLDPMAAAGMLETTLARDVERIEFLFRGAMLRVYTRPFMRTMLGGGLQLREPVYVEIADPPYCQ